MVINEIGLKLEKAKFEKFGHKTAIKYENRGSPDFLVTLRTLLEIISPYPQGPLPPWISNYCPFTHVSNLLFGIRIVAVSVRVSFRIFSVGRFGWKFLLSRLKKNILQHLFCPMLWSKWLDRCAPWVFLHN